MSKTDPSFRHEELTSPHFVPNYGVDSKRRLSPARWGPPGTAGRSAARAGRPTTPHRRGAGGRGRLDFGGPVAIRPEPAMYPRVLERRLGGRPFVPPRRRPR